jgi:hypothetical protein
MNLPAATASSVENFYWITTYPSGERTVVRCSDDEEISVANSLVCIMSDPQTSQVFFVALTTGLQGPLRYSFPYRLFNYRRCIQACRQLLIGLFY